MLKITRIVLHKICCSVIPMRKTYTLFVYLLLPVALSACDTLPTTDASNKAAGTSVQEKQAAESEQSSVKPSDQAPASAMDLSEADSDDSQDGGKDGSKAVDADSVKPKKEVILDGDMLFNLLAAEFAGNVGDLDDSLAYYRKASAEIDDSRVASRTAYIALYGKHYEEALEALDRWHELEPDATDLSRMYAVTYLKLGQPDDAVPYIEKTISGTSASSSEKALAVKQLLAQETDIPNAYLVLQKMNAKPVKNRHLLILQSRYAAQLKYYDEALVLLDEVLAMDDSQHEVLLIKARVLSAQGKSDEAVAVTRQVVDELPDNNTLRLQYARMLVEQHKMQEATEQYAMLHENLPKDSDIALSMSLLYIETKQLDKARVALEDLAENKDKAAVANYYLGRIAQNKGEQEQAISFYGKVKDGEYVYDARLRIAIMLAIMGRTDESLADLQALAEDQTSWALRLKSYLAQGEILRSERRYKEAVEMYSRALQQKRDDTTLLYARGLMAEKVDRLDMAEADLLKVISKEPNNADALNALGYTLADRTSRYEEALEYIKRAAELVPDDPAILDSLGWVSYRLGHMDDALKWLSQAFAKLEDAEIAAHYGEVLWHTNQKEKAREVWNIGKEKNADNPVLIETLKRINP